MIGVDTNLMIWGVKKQAAKGQEGKIDLAKAFFAHCRKEKLPILLPTQVLAEYLVDYTEAERADAMTAAEEDFFLADLDPLAAAIAAEIRYAKDIFDGVRTEFKLTRQIVKADINILATCVAAGASRLVSSNVKEMRNLAQGRIIVEGLEDFLARVAAEDQTVPAKPKTKPKSSDNKSGQKSLFGTPEEDAYGSRLRSLDLPAATTPCHRFNGHPTPAIASGTWRVGRSLVSPRTLKG